MFGTEAAAGKSLGTDLAKGKLTYPVLLAWERATPAERKRLEEAVNDWQPAAFAFVNGLLSRHETLQPSVGLIGKYLDQARQSLRALPESAGRAGLFGVTDYLARQTAILTE